MGADSRRRAPPAVAERARRRDAEDRTISPRPRNAPGAAPTIRAALLVRDGERDTATIDIYLTKTERGVFEATSYDRDFAAPSAGFPHAAPPLSVDRIVFDPAYQAIVSAAAGQPRRRSRPGFGSATPDGSLAAVAAIGAATMFAMTLTLAAGEPALAAITALLGAAAFAYAFRSRSAR